jgi:hypothetical protein
MTDADVDGSTWRDDFGPFADSDSGFAEYGLVGRVS